MVAAAERFDDNSVATKSSSPSLAEQLVKKEGSNLNYLIADYLAEVTMGILARRRNQSLSKGLGGAGEGGYIAEFIAYVLKPLWPDLMKNNIKIITNAGGLDPLACKNAIEKLLKEEFGIEDNEKVRVAAITGDDILTQYKKNIIERGEVKRFTHIAGNDKDADFYPDDKKEVISLNAYLGAIPIAKALDLGATIVITGRCVDSALAVGALIHEFRWDTNTEWDKLASGSLAGHIIECGCQATGGNFTDWEQSAFSTNRGWINIGYPIVECYENGEFVVTKPKETGGLVTTATVGEQMLYEILDPGAYILPDVVLDLRNVELKQIGTDRVLVTGAKGRPPTEDLKVSGVYVDGYKMNGMLAKAVGHAIISKTRKLLIKAKLDDFRNFNVEVLGAEHTYGHNARTRNTREVVLNITVHHDNPKALKIFGMELAPAATCMAPGITGVGSGRPHPSPCLVHFSCLISKNSIPAYIIIGSNNNNPTKTTILFNAPTNNQSVIPPPQPSSSSSEIDDGNSDNNKKLVKVPLIKLAWGRSGDKGILARDPKFYPILKKSLTEQVVKDYMTHMCKGIVKRYELPGCHGLNFVLTKSLGGGGLSSLQIDKQGKTFAQMLLSVEIDVPINYLSKL
ncbi:13298_t:CDS:10 [Entrophospora sp. SA101]|nr:13298_t:CDS:10 [Entrophospora sp. SA101]